MAVMMNKKIRQLWQRLRANRKMSVLIVSLIGVLVIAVVGVGLFVNGVFTDEAGSTEPQEVVDKRVTLAEKDGKLRDAASAEAKKGDVDKVGQLYESAIKDEDEVIRKLQLSVDQSAVLYAAGKQKEAIEVATKASNLSDDTFLISDWLARVYEDQKEYDMAAAQYREAARWASSPQNQTGITKDMYEAEANRVLKLKAGGQ